MPSLSVETPSLLKQHRSTNLQSTLKQTEQIQSKFAPQFVLIQNIHHYKSLQKDEINNHKCFKSLNFNPTNAFISTSQCRTTKTHKNSPRTPVSHSKVKNPFISSVFCSEPLFVLILLYRFICSMCK